MHPIKKEILDYIEKQKGAFYGDIVMNFRYPKNIVLKQLMELKEEGVVFKENDGGKFNLVNATN